MTLYKLLPRLVVLISLSVLCGCSSVAEKKSATCNQNHTIQATYYFQTSAENAALYHQGFNIAKNRIDEIMKEKHDKQPAVVLDIDETVLDNSPFQVESIHVGEPYSEERWGNWVKKEIAKPVPGGVDFIKYALDKGIAVVFITNRSEKYLEATLRNMKALGFPELPAENYYFRTNESDKTKRRAAVSEKYNIQLLMGDNLSDFSEVFENRAENYGMLAVETNKLEFGKRFIAFPNPTYGDWQKSALAVKDSCTSEVMLKRLRSN